MRAPGVRMLLALLLGLGVLAALPAAAAKPPAQEPLVVAPNSTGNQVELSFSLPKDLPPEAKAVKVRVDELKGPDWVKDLSASPQELTLSPGGQGSLTLAFGVGKTPLGSRGALKVALSLVSDQPGAQPRSSRLTLPLVVDQTPAFKVVFTPATPKGKPTLTLTLTAAAPLEASSLKVRLDDKDLPCKVEAQDGGKVLVARHEFSRSLLPPDQHQVQVEVKAAGAGGQSYRLQGRFEYLVSLALAGLRVDDQKQGNTPNGKIESGEEVGLFLKLVSLEPSPLKDVKVTLPAHPLLMPPAGSQWVVGDMSPGRPVEAGPLVVKVGTVDKARTLALRLAASVEGKGLVKPLSLRLPLWPGFGVVAQPRLQVQDPKDLSPRNNADGLANAGEKLNLVVRLENVLQDASPAWQAKVSSSSPLLSLGRDQFSGPALAPRAVHELTVPVQVGDKIAEPVVVKLVVETGPQGQALVNRREIPLRLEPPPLPLKLVGHRLEDPASGDLISVNDGNGKLGSGEHGFLTLKIANQGPALSQVYFDLTSEARPRPTIIKKVQGLDIPANGSVEPAFELKLPIDYQKAGLPLVIRAVAGKRTWKQGFTLPTEPRRFFRARLVLLDPKGAPAAPGDLHPGAKLPFRLEVKCTGGKEEKGLEVTLRSPWVSLVPNLFDGQSFAPGQEKTFEGTLTIPKDLTRGDFTVYATVFDPARQLARMREKFKFQLGAAPTEVKVKATPPAQAGGPWKLGLEVRDTREHQPVTAGVVLAKTNLGRLSEERLVLSGGKGELTWSPPPDLQGRQALITLAYQGDQEDPAQPDRRYQPSLAKLTLPPAATPTRVKLAVKREGQPAARRFRFLLQVVDEEGKPVRQGVLAVKADLGRLSGAGLSAQGGKIKLTGREVVLIWQGPADATQKGQAVFAYLGDQEDPAKPDLVYAPSRTSLELPPVVLTPTHLVVEPALIDQDKGIWRLSVKLSDETGKPVSPAKVRFSADGGSFALGGEVREVEKELQNGACEKGWRETDGKQHRITVSYPGDQSGPGKTNQLYAPAQVELTLPPNLIARSTVFVVDASGSMSGQKLASAKAAVRAALAAYAPDQKDEEWALIVFAGCGNIRLVQPFTTNPGDVTSKLTFSAGGSTPIAAAMSKAARYIRRAGRGREGRIILLSDGGENCRGDPVKAAEGIHRRVRAVTPGGRRGRP